MVQTIQTFRLIFVVKLKKDYCQKSEGYFSGKIKEKVKVDMLSLNKIVEKLKSNIALWDIKATSIIQRSNLRCFSVLILENSIWKQ